MSIIKAYTFTPRNVASYESVWDAKKKQFIPVKSMDDVDLYMVLDAITLAVEAGVVDTHAWPQQFFASRAAFDEFMELLSEYDDCFRITDQWWQALASLADIGDEEDFVSSTEIADGLFRVAAGEGLLNNWGKKKPTYKYSEKQVEEAIFALIKHGNAGYGNTFLSHEQCHKASEIAGFGKRHYDFELSPALVKQAQKEGVAIAAKSKSMKPVKKSVKKTK